MNEDQYIDLLTSEANKMCQRLIAKDAIKNGKATAIHEAYPQCVAVDVCKVPTDKFSRFYVQKIEQLEDVEKHYSKGIYG